METRVDRLTRRVVASMTQVEMEDWDDALTHLGDELDDFWAGLQDGEMTGINRVGRAVQGLEREERNVEGPETRTKVDGLLAELAKMLNTAEVERRRFEDENVKHVAKCQAIGREAQELAKKFRVMEGSR